LLQTVESPMDSRTQAAVWRKLQLQPQRAVLVLAIFFSALLCALVLHDLQRDYAQQISGTSSKTRSLTQMLEEHARQSMRRVELSLSLAAHEVQVQHASKDPSRMSMGSRLRAYLPPDGLIASFALINLQGHTVASTWTEDQGEMPRVTDRDYFQAQQNAPAGTLFVGAAVKSRISGQWIIPVSVRLEEGLDGYLLAMLDPQYFQHFYQSIDTGDAGFITLFTVQGRAVAHWPFSPETVERSWLESPLFQQHIPLSGQGTVREPLLAAGVDSVYSYRVLPDYPLVVSLGLSLDESLAPWRQRVWIEGTGLALALLFLWGSTVMLRGQLRRRQQAEVALQLSETSLLKSSLATLWVGPDARILRVNQAACTLHAMPEAQLLALTVPDLNPNMSMASWTAHWQRLRESRHMRFESVHINGLGQSVPVEVELNFIEFEGQEFNFAFMRDISERKRDEAEIQRSGALLRGAIDAMDEAFVVFGADDRLIYCNSKYVELYPHLRDQVVPGARFEDLIRLGARRGLYRESVGHEEEWIAERLRAHRAGDASRIQKLDDGRVLRVLDRRTPEGNIVGMRVDITEMVRATEAAQEASRYKSQFLANMSHEIRTPMNAVLGLLALLQNTDLSTTQRDYASKSASAARSLLGLLNEILDFSKVEAGKMELDPQPVRLDQLLRDIAVILASNLGGKSIEVLYDIDAAVPEWVVADAMRLQQVLVNLGSNAVKFTERGQVVLRLLRKPLPDSDASVLACLEFSMQDSGIGIDPQQQQHIFTGFSQAEASTTRRFGGTGLGLAICKHLAELMGGTLELQSTPGQGSCFSFSLQLPVPPEAGNGSAHPAQQPSIKPMQVLVVDDNPVAREILARMTRSWSWPTTLVDSGAQALELLQAQPASGKPPFDVIYLDWQIPGMDGWETVRKLRQICQGRSQQPRVVMLSSNGRDTLRARTLQEQALVDDFLQKPVTASALQDAALGQTRPDTGDLPRSSHRPLAGMRILVVEDNLINQQVAEELLIAEGALVALAANGQLGVDAVAASQPPFDVVLMDIQMPVLDGYDATRKIRQQLGFTSLPIVAMTANAMASDRLACLAAGMTEHVGKPFDVRHLVSLLLAVTGHTAPADLDTQAPAAAASVALAPSALAVQEGLNSAYLDVEAALERLSGLHALYLTVAQEYLLTLDAVEGEFRQAADKHEWPSLRAQMHSLKGVSATLGAMPLSAHAAELEKLFRTPTQDMVAMDCLPALLELVQATHAATEQALHSLQLLEDPPPAARPLAHGQPERATARAFLGELQELLAASDMAATDRFEQRGMALDALPAEVVEQIAHALQSLDLDGARQLCLQHMADLELH
jgi:PAS domain S-box-containing protein